MKHLFAFIVVLALAGTLKGLQAGSAPQTAPAAPAAPVAPPGKTADQQKADQSQCIKWAKQQAGLSQPDAQQPAAAGGNTQAGAAAANQGTAPANQGAAAANQAAPANQGAAAKPTDNAVQSATSSAVNEAESKLGLSGAANSKLTQLAKDAYAQCMEKKGYKTK
ncbi:MAG TPA: hypothetical protein VKH81_20790 [Candidatus Angelobacter sp.]|nr:hypothetical protein [Candidatus Angelobacter sp.]